MAKSVSAKLYILIGYCLPLPLFESLLFYSGSFVSQACGGCYNGTPIVVIVLYI